MKALIDDVHAALVAATPPQRGATIVHGDYRLDNTMLGTDGRVAAVLDWELCTLGDPLADVGMLLTYWPEAGDAFTPLGSSPRRSRVRHPGRARREVCAQIRP